MRILAVDTSTQAGGLAVLEERRVVKNVFERSDEEYSSRVFRQLDFLLQETQLRLSDFDFFAVSAGPGSFTSLRIGMTAVKAWAELYGTLICPVSGLKAMASQSKGGNLMVAAIMDARRGQVFGGVFKRGEGRWDAIGEEVVSRPDEFLSEIPCRFSNRTEFPEAVQVSIVSPTPDILRASLSGSAYQDLPIEKVSEDLAPWIGVLAFDMAQRGETVTALALDANYIRRSDAELYWKDSNARSSG
jgi:tRNA threonylcarbamoyladenosine biosynthesis protein TsaB